MLTTALKLRAEDEEDLKIISAYLQDAVIRLGDTAYLPKAHRFALLLNRYRWEDEIGEGACRRVRAGLHFDGVLRVQVLKIPQHDPDVVLELLTLQFTPGEDGAGIIDLRCAAGGCIRLHVECIDATLGDIGGPWEARCRPTHDLETR
jgi:hypothetical protein